MAMSLTQKTILRSASTLLKPGGRLVYAVCSPEPEEGRLVVEDFLKRNTAFELTEVIDSAPPQGFEDAFYAAKMVRVGS